MGLFGNKSENDVPLDFFILDSARARLNDDAFRLLSSLVENIRGISPILAIKGHAAVGHLSQPQLDSFGKEVFRGTYDDVLNAAKRAKPGDMGDGGEDFPSPRIANNFYSRIDDWIGVRSDNSEPRDVLTIGYFGAAFDLMNLGKPRMVLSGRLVTEGCAHVTALTLMDVFK
jgi:hypothetical protein